MAAWGDSRVVSTPRGQLQGKRLLPDAKLDKPIDAFLGVPFAKPPIGPLRYKKPEAPEPWSGVKEAKTWGPVAIQPVIPGMPQLHKQSEDCLTLNVFAPTWDAPSGKGFPVMLFIHGGGYVIGDAASCGYEGTCRYMVSKGVIVVTIQYRLGYLGFWAADDSSIPTNLGLWDQVQALKWVQENIGSFGGDKESVTIFGLSAGGGSVDLLTLSPHSNLLFHRIIGLCGSAYCPWATNSREKQHQFCSDKLKELGLEGKSESEVYDALMALDAATFAVAPYSDIIIGFHGAPIIDGDFFPESLEELRKKAPAIPVITGVSSMEALLFDFFKLPGHNRDDIKASVEKEAADRKGDAGKLSEAVHDFYEIHDAAKAKIGSTRYISDFLFDASALRMCQEVSSLHKDNPVYLYVFEHFNPKSFDMFPVKIEVKYSTHGSEMPYCFGTGMLPVVLEEDDYKMIEIWTRVITNFAKYSDPNGCPSDASTAIPVAWPRLTTEHNERHLLVSLTPSVKDGSFLDGRPARLIEIFKAHAAKI